MALNRAGRKLAQDPTTPMEEFILLLTKAQTVARCYFCRYDGSRYSRRDYGQILLYGLLRCAVEKWAKP